MNKFRSGRYTREAAVTPEADIWEELRLTEIEVAILSRRRQSGDQAASIRDAQIAKVFRWVIADSQERVNADPQTAATGAMHAYRQLLDAAPWEGG